MSATTTDRIERQILLRAPRSRVWRALTTPREFGAWFGVRLDGTFTPGARASGQVTHKGYEHVMWDVVIEEMVPERRFSWRWHPHAVDPNVDYSNEPTTLVTFTLEDSAEGTLLTVVESGFDAIPMDRRLEAFRMNSDGWSAQLENIANHVRTAA